MKIKLIIICLCLAVAAVGGSMSADLSKAKDNTVSEYELNKESPITTIESKDFVTSKIARGSK